MEQQNLMMQNGMPAPMNTMQRPQAGNLQQQVHGKIMHDLRNTMSQVPQGWQTTMDPRERAQKIMQLVSGLRMLNSDVAKCIGIAHNFELTTIQESASKEEYMAKMQQKNEQIAIRRRSQAQAQPMAPGQLGMGMNPNMPGMPNGMNMHNNPMAGMNMANAGMGMPNGMNPNLGQPNQSFPAHLQRQMQPSQISPGQQPATMDPSALQNPSMPNMPQGQNQPQPNMNNAGQGAPKQPPSNQDIQNMAQTLYNQLPDEKKGSLRSSFLNSLSEPHRANMNSQKGDPLMAFLVSKSKDMLIKRYRAGQGGQPNAGNMQMNNGQGMGGNAQQQSTQGGVGNGDLSNFLGQQANALKSAESGEQVVPASNNVNFNIGGQMNMSQGINPQQMMANQANQNSNNPQVTNQMQFLMLQQEKQQQQQRMQRANILAQQQAMSHTQQAAQLRGQPGGLNASGPIQSPAMSMLTRPMMPPGQAAPGTPQQPPNRPQGIPPTPMTAASQLQQHHQSMLNQNNAQLSQGGQNPQQDQLMAARRGAFLANLPPTMREKISSMAPQQINEFMIRYIKNQQQNQQQNGMSNMPNQPGMANLNAGNQQTMFNNLQNMSAVPGFNAQPPPNQQNQAQIEPMQLQRMQQHQNQQKPTQTTSYGFATIPSCSSPPTGCERPPRL